MVCQRCGACCNEGRILPLDKPDFERWVEQGRMDILKHSKIQLKNGKFIRGDQVKIENLDQISFNGSSLLWYSPKGRRLNKCPFLRKLRTKPEYKCLINDTKPDRCRKYEPWNQGLQWIRHFNGYKCCKKPDSPMWGEVDINIKKSHWGKQ
jgi:Fe-S-cluster containining protein